MNSDTALSNSSQDAITSFNDLPKYVRVRSAPDAKFVMFDFAIGDSSLFVELVLPPTSFEEFCANNNVIPMTSDQMDFNDHEEDKWRYGTESTLVGSNHSEARSH